MRRRATFVRDGTSDFDPNAITIQGRQLSFHDLKAAREERLTIGLRELPEEIHHILQNSHELHIRWVSETRYDKAVPYLSALPPGLHVSFTPLTESPQDLLCPVLRNLFGRKLKCQSVEKSFTKPSLISERFASTASWQYYSLLPSLKEFVSHIQRDVCLSEDNDCMNSAELIHAVDYIDIDYNSISHALDVTAFWSSPPSEPFDSHVKLSTNDRWKLTVNAAAHDKVEIGILEASDTPDPHDLQLGGFLTVVGEDTKPKPTMFFFPSRHHALHPQQAAQQLYTVSFERPTGLHPTMAISFPNSSSLKEPTRKPVDSTCALHAYLTLPSVLFADEYAFTSDDALFQDAHNIRQLRSFSGEKDLEAPDYVIEKWGSSMLLELQTPLVDKDYVGHEPWTVTLPLHLRYLEPAEQGHREVQIPWPAVFWACTAEEGTKFSVNPFDRVNLGYDGLFGTRTMFYHLDAKPSPRDGDKLVETLRVPVLDSAKSGHQIVEICTSLVILLGFLWVLLRLVPGLRRTVYMFLGKADENGKHAKKMQ